MYALDSNSGNINFGSIALSKNNIGSYTSFKLTRLTGTKTFYTGSYYAVVTDDIVGAATTYSLDTSVTIPDLSVGEYLYICARVVGSASKELSIFQLTLE